jgi:FAD/FMN-containing dehydrogenase
MSRNATQHVCSDGSAKLVAVILFCIAIPAVSAAIRGPLAAAPMITVRVVDNAGVPGHTLRDAAAVAQRIFRKAGVKTRWLRCSPPQESDGQDVGCTRAMVSAELRVDIEPRSMEKAIRKYFRMSASAFGAVLFGADGHPTAFAYVLYGRIEEASLSSTPCSRAVLLGHVLAHEIGHLLLGSAHSRLGLMSANWDQRVYTKMACGQLEFGDDEAQRLQAEAGARNRQKQADTDGGLIAAR